MYEAKCVNPACPAAQVWVLDVEKDGRCTTCGLPFADLSDQWEQKQADPDRAPDTEPEDV